jgi:hypothetical protein
MSDQARIQDYSDREILGIIVDAGGIVTAQELAARIFAVDAERDGDAAKHAARCCVSRLAWMKRFGLVEKGEAKGEWELTGEGRALRSAKLGRAMSSAIHNVQDGSGMVLAHEIGLRLVRARPVARTAMRRELMHQILRGK